MGDKRMQTQVKPIDKPEHAVFEWWAEPTPLVAAHATLRLFRALISHYLQHRGDPGRDAARRLRARIA
jgi:hypothetical protein